MLPNEWERKQMPRSRALKDECYPSLGNCLARFLALDKRATALYIENSWNPPDAVDETAGHL